MTEKATITIADNYSYIEFHEFTRMKPMVVWMNYMSDGSWTFDVLWDENIIEADHPEAAAFLESAAISELDLEESDIAWTGDKSVIDGINSSRATRVWTVD